MRWRGNHDGDVRNKKKFLLWPHWDVATQKYVWLELVTMRQVYRNEHICGRRHKYWKDVEIV